MERRRKRLFNNYFKKNNNNYMLVYDFDNDFYLVSNGISLMKIRKNKDLIVNGTENFNTSLLRYIENFKKYTDLGKRIEDNFKEYDIIAKYNDYSEYSVDIDLLKTCSDIIIPKQIKVLENTTISTYIQCVIYMENEDTQEFCYILPIKVY